jgi:hypothetical protein
MRKRFTLVATERALLKVRAEIATCSIEDPVAVLIEYSDAPPQATAMLRAGTATEMEALKSDALAWLNSDAAPPRRMKPALYPRQRFQIGMKPAEVDGITFYVPRQIAAATLRALLDFDGRDFRLTSGEGLVLMPTDRRAVQR